MKKKIAILLNHKTVSSWQMTREQAEYLAQKMPDYEVELCLNKETFLTALPEAEIVLTWEFRQEWVPRAKKLKILATPAAGKDYFQVEFPPNVRRIHGQFHGAFMAETALGMLLGMRRGLLPMASNWQQEVWPRTQMAAVMRPLSSSTTMVLGFGKIGQSVGKILKPLQNRILGVRYHENREKRSWMSKEDRVLCGNEWLDYLPEVDQLVAVLPRSSSTDHIIDEKVLSALPKHAVFCNLGRGNAVDEEALCAALRRGDIAGACLDVFQEEPLPAESPIRNCPNLWWQPHSSAIVPNYLNCFVDDFIRQL
ncbi:MAG: NAD(P)-dependent oxidoreductase [Lentisphaeria bacterium]